MGVSEMTDPALEGAPVAKTTLCKVGTHTFIYAGSNERIMAFGFPADPYIWCDCGSYRWIEWRVRRLSVRRDIPLDNAACAP